MVLLPCGQSVPFQRGSGELRAKRCARRAGFRGYRGGSEYQGKTWRFLCCSGELRAFVHGFRVRSNASERVRTSANGRANRRNRQAGGCTDAQGTQPGRQARARVRGVYRHSGQPGRPVDPFCGVHLQPWQATAYTAHGVPEQARRAASGMRDQRRPKVRSSGQVRTVYQARRCTAQGRVVPGRQGNGIPGGPNGVQRATWQAHGAKAGRHSGAAGPSSGKEAVPGGMVTIWQGAHLPCGVPGAHDKAGIEGHGAERCARPGPRPRRALHTRGGRACHDVSVKPAS